MKNFWNKVSYYGAYVLKCVLIVLVGFAVIGLLFGIGSLFGPDQGPWSKAKLDWNYGAIELTEGDEGALKASYSSGFDSIYTPDLIKCTGYKLTLSFPAGSTLDVVYFDAEDNCIGVKTITSPDRYVFFGAGADELPDGLAGIRLCLTPDHANAFEFYNMNVGNWFIKNKYAGYVGLETTNAPAA